MASIYKRGNYWWIDYYVDGKHKQKSLRIKATTANKSIALELKKKYEDAINIKHHRFAINKITLIDVAQEFLQEKILETKYITNYIVAIKTLVQNEGDNLLTSYNPHQMKMFRVKLLERLSENSVNNYLNHLKIFFNWCIKKNYISENPINFKFKPQQTFKRIIPDEHLHKLLWYLRVHNLNQYCLVKFLLLTGFRRNEVLSLTWNDIDLNEKIIKVKTTKDKRVDSFPIYDRLEKLLALIPKSKDKLLNYSKDGLKFWYRALEKLNLPKYSLHDLRRKFGTIQAQNGMSPYKLQKLMRHKDIRTTLKYYVDVDIRKIAPEIK